MQPACGGGNSGPIFSTALSTLFRFGSLFWRHNVHRKRVISAERDGYYSQHKFDKQTVPATDTRHSRLIGNGRRGSGLFLCSPWASWTQSKRPAPFLAFPHGSLAALALANARLTVDQQCGLKSRLQTNAFSPIRRKITFKFSVRDDWTTPASGHDAFFVVSCLERSFLFEDHADLAPG